MLAGLGVARAGIRRMRVQLWMLGAGAVLAATGYGLDAAAGANESTEAMGFLGRGLDRPPALQRCARGDRIRRIRARRDRAVPAGVPDGADVGGAAAAGCRCDAAHRLHRAARRVGDRRDRRPGRRRRPARVPGPRAVLAACAVDDRRMHGVGAARRAGSARVGRRPGGAARRAALRQLRARLPTH